jgi:hypothetical protein
MMATRATWSVLAALALLGGCGGSDTPPRPKSDAAADLGGGVDAAKTPDLAGTPGPDAGNGPDAMSMCLGPIPDCTPSPGGACDHVCQARCGCGQRCAIFSGAPACVPPAPAPVALGGACSATLDDCSAGAVCLGEASESCGSHCYRFCRTSADCPSGAQCDLDVEVASKTVAKACSAPPEKCDPTGAAPCANAARPSPLFACYVQSQNPDSAVCDCAGGKNLGEACMFEHECAPGLECIRVGNGGGVCRRVCHLGVSGSCQAGTTCAPLGTAAAPSTIYGYCAS